MSLHNSPHASTHSSSLSPPPQYLTERHSPDTIDSFYHDQPHMPQRRCTVPGYPASTYPSAYRSFHDPGAAFDAENAANGVLSYPQAGGDISFPLSGTQPSADDLYLNQATEFPAAQLQPDFADSPMPSRDYFDPSAFANQSPNPVTERNLLENIVQQALSAQKAFERGERFTVQERLAEITRVLHDLGLGKGVLGLDGALPPFAQDPPLPTGAASVSSMSPPMNLGASSSPLMYVGSIGGVEVPVPPNPAKRAAELDEGPKKAPKLTPPREMEKAGSASPGHSPPLPGITPGMTMNGVAMGSAPNLLNRSQTSGLPMHPPPPLMHAHTFPGGLHAPHVSSPLAGIPYENMAAMPAPPPESMPSFRNERTPPSAVDPYVAHMYQPLPTQTQGHHPGYQISRPPSSHSMHSDDSDDDSDDHVKQEQGANNVFGRSLAFPRMTPPKARTSDTGLTTMSHSANTLPPELKSEVDRVFFKFLNRICSNLDATDSKGEAIHQTLMAKKMARLDELPDFRPFKFRIQAFTNGFLEELANEGYPDEVIPMKKIKSYLWNQPFISRFNEDGKKAKSKGNHIWNIDARKLDNGGPLQWTFREFKRKIAGTPPGIAYHGHHWQWAPHVWDPQVSRANITATFSSPSLPSWLSWNDNVLSGTPGPDAVNTDITVTAKVLGDNDEQVLSHTFHLTIAPSAVDPAFVKSRRPSLAHDVRRNVSDSAVNQDGMRTRAGSTSSNPSDNHQVMQVLASAVSRVTHAAHAAQAHNGISYLDADQLAKQQQVLGVTAQAVADEVRAGPHPDAQGTASVLVAAAHSVVVGAAQLVVTDRVAQATRNAADPASLAPAQAPISVTEVSVATQSAVAHAVALNGPMATEVEVMMTANALIQQQQVAATNEALESTQMLNGAASGVPPSVLNGTASGSVSPQMGQIGDHRSRSMSSLGNSVPTMGGPMNVGLATGLGPGLDGMSAIVPMHGMTGLVSNGMQ